MARKGQLTTTMILVGFIGIIVALVLLQGTFSYIGAATNSYALVNRTFTTGNAGTTIDLIGQELFDTPVISNRTGNGTTLLVVANGNFTIAEGISSVDGLKRIRLTTTTAGGLSGYNASVVNISYNYGQEGYIDDAGGRGVANMIPIMAALAIVLVAVFLGYQKGWFE